MSVTSVTVSCVGTDDDVDAIAPTDGVPPILDSVVVVTLRLVTLTIGATVALVGITNCTDDVDAIAVSDGVLSPISGK